EGRRHEGRHTGRHAAGAAPGPAPHEPEHEHDAPGPVHLTPEERGVAGKGGPLTRLRDFFRRA
ncbi:hypothetical protein GPJ59_35855, partial [Streptomyces bambusae]|nr:hypothetical protein [Streptomyces bambusae]